MVKVARKSILEKAGVAGERQAVERLTRLEVEEIVVRVTDEQATSFQQPGHTLTCAMC